MTRKQLLLFLYGTPNIVGSLLGILGLLLFAAGIIQQFWLLIVIGLYIVGVVVTPRNTQYEFVLRNELSMEELRAELENLLRLARTRVPDELYQKLLSIQTSIVSILPQISDINSANYNIHVIRQTVFDYLPTALQNYLNLPPAFANIHPVKDGKTARQLLGEQLDLLDQEMKEIVTDMSRDDSQKLVVHGRFLQDKFSNADLFGLNQPERATVLTQ